MFIISIIVTQHLAN